MPVGRTPALGDDFVTVVKEPVDQVARNEAGAPGDETFHAVYAFPSDEKAVTVGTS